MIPNNPLSAKRMLQRSVETLQYRFRGPAWWLPGGGLNGEGGGLDVRGWGRGKGTFMGRSSAAATFPAGLGRSKARQRWYLEGALDGALPGPNFLPLNYEILTGQSPSRARKRSVWLLLCFPVCLVPTANYYVRCEGAREISRGGRGSTVPGRCHSNPRPRGSRWCGFTSRVCKAFAGAKSLTATCMPPAPFPPPPPAATPAGLLVITVHGPS